MPHLVSIGVKRIEPVYSLLKRNPIVIALCTRWPTLIIFFCLNKPDRVIFCVQRHENTAEQDVLLAKEGAQSRDRTLLEHVDFLEAYLEKSPRAEEAQEHP